MHIFHKWSKWETEVVDVFVVPGLLSKCDKPYECRVVRQRRTCKKCGIIQSREIES